jgi:glycosyltransferase involved in cell wall biosynthesis
MTRALRQDSQRPGWTGFDGFKSQISSGREVNSGKCENRTTLSIVHLDTARDFRGGQQALLGLARGLRERGHHQTILTPAGSELERRARAGDFPVAPLSALGLRRRLGGVDVLHSHSGRAQNIAWLAAAGMAVTRVATRHVAFSPQHPAIHRLKYSQTCDGVIAVSQAVRRVLLTAGVAGGRIEVIPTGVEVPAVTADADQRRAARREFGLEEQDFVAGHMGAFTPEKGQDVAAEAARLLESRLPRLRLLLAGDGPGRAALGGNPRVLLPGYVENKALFFAALDLFLMPSRSEGWGLAALEAMAHGVPVIASRTGGLMEIIDDGENGCLVEPGDAGALAEAIAGAARDRKQLAEMGRQGRERARDFSLEETAARTDAFYLRLRGRGRGPGQSPAAA